jgi:uncharacterized protein (TIGR03435 family)
MRRESAAPFVLTGLLIASLTQGQTPEPSQAAFEVASVKPSTPSDVHVWQITGGPGTRSPGQFSSLNAPLGALLLRAYGLRADQLFGPGSLDIDRFDIVAKIPQGATREQVNVMLRNLLMERFSLVARTETRDLTSYELVVAKGGVKMKEAEKAPAGGVPPNSPAAVFGPPKLSIGPDGAPALPPGTPMWVGLGEGGNARIVARMQTTAALANILENRVSRPVVDKTGLMGTYDFNLLYAPDTSRMPPPPPPPTADPAPNQGEGIDAVRDPVPDLFKAVEAQLGLKLEPKKTPGAVLVVERYNRTPSAN